MINVENLKLNIADMWLIPLDRVTYLLPVKKQPVKSYIQQPLMENSLTPLTSVMALQTRLFSIQVLILAGVVRCPDTTDYYRSWLVFKHLFNHAQASITLDPILLAQMILDSDQQIDGKRFFFYCRQLRKLFWSVFGKMWDLKGISVAFSKR